MDGFILFEAPWRQVLAAGIVLLGLAIFWRGLWGGPYGARGLLRRRVDMLERLVGWRLLLVGLTLVGLGTAWYTETRWLLFLALGIGFVEIQEATQLIRAWRWSGTGSRRPVPVATGGTRR
jgi:hypothetical protein